MLSAHELMALPAHEARAALLKQECDSMTEAFGRQVAATTGTNRAEAVCVQIEREVATWDVTTWAECSACEGVGHLYTRRGTWAMDCPECDGTGKDGRTHRELRTDLEGVPVEESFA